MAEPARRRTFVRSSQRDDPMRVADPEEDYFVSRSQIARRRRAVR